MFCFIPHEYVGGCVLLTFPDTWEREEGSCCEAQVSQGHSLRIPIATSTTQCEQEVWHD